LKLPLGVFAHPVFRAVFLASLVSNVGTFVQDVGEAWMMVRLGGSPLQIALVSATTWAPSLLVALPAGALADRLDRRIILAATQAWMALTSLGLAIATARGLVTPTVLLIATTSLGVGSALALPAWSTLVPELVPRRELADAVAVQSMSWNFARAVGPALGGVVVAQLGPAFAFALNAASFAGLIAVVARSPKIEREAGTLAMGPAIAAGIRCVIDTRDLRVTVATTALFGLVASPLMALMPALVARVLGGGSLAFGVLLGSFGAGAIVGALSIRAAREALRPRTLVPVCAAITACATLGQGLAPSLGWAVAATFPAGIAWLILLSTQNALVQTVSPEGLRGRVKSVDNLLFVGLFAIGGATSGALANVLGVRAVLVGSAALMLVVVAIARAASLPDLPAGEAP
jgi:MFS family permease